VPARPLTAPASTGAQVARERGERRAVDAVRRDHLEQCEALVAAHEGAQHVVGHQCEEGRAGHHPVRDTGERAHAAHARITSERGRESRRRDVAALVERASGGRQHDDDPQRLHHAATPHGEQGTRAACGLGRARQPVAARELRLQSCRLYGEQRERQAGDDQRAYGMARHARRPSAPARRGRAMRTRKHASDLDARAE
jgi:hypothetical protein